MLLSANFSIIFLGGFEKFIAAVTGKNSYALTKRLHLLRLHGLKTFSNGQILLPHAERIHAADGSCNRQAHSVTQRIRWRRRAVRNNFSRAAHTLHTKHSDTAAVRFRHYLGFKAAESRIQAVQWHLDSIKREVLRQHPQMNCRVFVTRKSDESNFPLLFRG